MYSPVAVALYDYESLGDGEDDSLEFEEGELIEVRNCMYIHTYVRVFCSHFFFVIVMYLISR